MLRQSFNQDWLFTQEGTQRSEVVTLPHDAMLHTERKTDTQNYFLLVGFQGGKYLYQKTFFVSQAYADKDVILELEGVYCTACVQVNGENVAEHHYGFTGFSVNLSSALRFGEENEITVVADVPEDRHNRWYTGGGIYRPVNIYVAEKNHIPLYGVKITTLDIHPAKVRIETTVEGKGEVEVKIVEGICEESAPIWQPDREGETGKIAGAAGEILERQMQGKKLVACGKGTDVTLEIPDAGLWSAEHPNLYTAFVTLKTDGQVTDIAVETFGIRILAVNPQQGLLVNGEPVFLKGGCIHNDNGVIGVINNDATELHRAQIIKKSGFNAIRSAHHPMSRSLMRACDILGIYVMNEAFDYWYRPKGQAPYLQYFMQEYKEDTLAMVKESYSHPSVIMYSIGNEIPEGGGVKGVRIGRSMLDTIHSYDNTRLTTFCPSVHWLREYLDGVPYLTVDEDEWMAQDPAHKELDWKNFVKIFMGAALNLPDEEKGMVYPPSYVKKDEEATKNLYPYLDVAGYNYYNDKYDTLHELHPERVILGTETQADKIVKTMRHAKEHPYVIGDFIWTLQDHLGEANVCGISYGQDNAAKRSSYEDGREYPWLVNYSGMIDLIGTILPSTHLFEFAWGEQKGIFLAAQPPVHQGIAPTFVSYKWTDSVDGWTFEGCEGEKTFVDVYTDACEAEVLVNGVSQGRQNVTDYFAKFLCVYEPGEVVAIGYDESGKELYRNSMKTAGAKTKITATADKKQMQAGGDDVCYIQVEITDEQGNLKLLPEHNVSITVEGEGTLQGFGSAYHMNEEKYNQKTHRTYLGRLLAVIRSGKNAGNVKVTFSADGMAEECVELQVANGIKVF